MNKIYRVSEINSYVREILTSIPGFANLSVRGEIINLKRYARAVYFTLKEQDEARISAVSFNVHRFPATLKDGDEVVVTGRISLHEKSGTYQLIGEEVVYYGLGAKLVALKALYEKLAKTGIFSDERKLTLPRYPKRVGVIAPRDSAALSDIVSNINRRYPLVTLVIKEAIVQGDLAPASISKAYNEIIKHELDVLILARGGGSSDDLWAFNDEGVVLTFAKRTVPFISAIGHEIDTTLVDYLSDARASTPTAAAELAVPHQEDIIQTIIENTTRINNALLNRLSSYEATLEALRTRPVLINYNATLKATDDKLTLLQTNLTTRLQSLLQVYEKNVLNVTNQFKQVSERLLKVPTEKLVTLQAKLQTLNPKLVLSRGYAFITRADEIIKSKHSLHKDEIIKIQFSDGEVRAKVEEEDE